MYVITQSPFLVAGEPHKKTVFRRVRPYRGPTSSILSRIIIESSGVVLCTTFNKQNPVINAEKICKCAKNRIEIIKHDT